MVIMTATLAFIAGFNHASMGYKEYNPYPKGTLDHTNWAAGFRASRSGEVHPAMAFGTKPMFSNAPRDMRSKIET